MKTPTALVPTTIAECQQLAHALLAAGMTDDREIAAAEDRVRRLGAKSIAEALEANLFAKIYAGAVRGIDAVMSIRLFSIFNGSIRAVREGPLALVQASGMLEEIDERIILFDDLQDLVHASLREAGPARPRSSPDRIAAARLRWCGDTPDWGKLQALDRAATDLAALVEQNGREDGKGYRAAVCVVRRAGTWTAEIYDLDRALQQGRLESEWWQKYQDKALTYAARQPLLHRVFGDVLAGIAVEDDDGPATIPAPAAAEPLADAGTDVDDDVGADGGGLHRGVR